MLQEVKRNIKILEKQFLMEEDSDASEDEQIWKDLESEDIRAKEEACPLIPKDEETQMRLPPERIRKEKDKSSCIPIQADVMKYDFKNLGEV